MERTGTRGWPTERAGTLHPGGGCSRVGCAGGYQRHLGCLDVHGVDDDGVDDHDVGCGGAWIGAADDRWRDGDGFGSRDGLGPWDVRGPNPRP